MSHLSALQLKQLFPETSGNTLSSLIVSPDNIRFATQDTDEKILILSRASWFTNVGWVVNMIIGIVFYFILSIILANIGFIQQYPGYFFVGNLIYILALIDYSLTNFTKWYYNIYIITDKRIIDYDFFPFAGMKISEAALVNVEDVTQTQKGLFADMFNYGDIIVQTAAERLQFRFESVPNPTYIRNKIVDIGTALKELDKTSGN